ncbi:hypothetical protein EUTSA_v10012209mg [Eutrema salsugineum]|uniref:DUF7086 domain-containing protein n=1 Tax=Eutrema salsugineum TaxID=72664 RepID=V4KT71_EUTSA|nr:uncharacterized protein LOC18011274 [Eutrema salsugineum]ESQ30553.1 hypothetical protein EUTSA_v10012209mg [Eutrema salsugineum]
MNDDAKGGNQRRRARQIDGEDDRTTNRRRQANEPRIDAAQDDDDAPLPLSLSLGPASYYSSQISPTTTPPLHVAPPPSFARPMTTWPSTDFTARFASQPHRYFMTSPPLMAPSFYQTGSRGSSQMQPPFNPSIDFFPHSAFAPPSNNQTSARPVRPITSAVESRRGYRSQSSGNRKDDTIPPPFPWATNIRGRIQSMENLESKQITTITGEVQCKHCEKVYQVSYNLREKFTEVENIFAAYKRIMRERAPPNWTNPEAARCELCGRDKAVKPVIAERKHKINWLFLLLGQTLGYCTLEQLKNFCKHCKSHRTGAKDRVLYLTYLGLCKMLKPNGELFNRDSSKR